MATSVCVGDGGDLPRGDQEETAASLNCYLMITQEHWNGGHLICCWLVYNGRGERTAPPKLGLSLNRETREVPKGLRLGLGIILVRLGQKEMLFPVYPIRFNHVHLLHIQHEITFTSRKIVFLAHLC